MILSTVGKRTIKPSIATGPVLTFLAKLYLPYFGMKHALTHVVCLQTEVALGTIRSIVWRIVEEVAFGTTVWNLEWSPPFVTLIVPVEAHALVMISCLVSALNSFKPCQEA